MKKIYYAFVLVLMALTSMNAMADISIKLDIDDASRVMVKVNYAPVANLVNGVNKLTVPQYGSVQIEAKDGFYLKRVYKPNKDGEFVEHLNSAALFFAIYFYILT